MGSKQLLFTILNFLLLFINLQFITFIIFYIHMQNISRLVKSSYGQSRHHYNKQVSSSPAQSTSEDFIRNSRLLNLNINTFLNQYKQYESNNIYEGLFYEDKTLDKQQNFGPWGMLKQKNLIKELDLKSQAKIIQKPLTASYVINRKSFDFKSVKEQKKQQKKQKRQSLKDIFYNSQRQVRARSQCKVQKTPPQSAQKKNLLYLLPTIKLEHLQTHSNLQKPIAQLNGNKKNLIHSLKGQLNPKLHTIIASKIATKYKNLKINKFNIKKHSATVDKKIVPINTQPSIKLLESQYIPKTKLQQPKHKRQPNVEDTNYTMSTNFRKYAIVEDLINKNHIIKLRDIRYQEVH